VRPLALPAELSPEKTERLRVPEAEAAGPPAAATAGPGAAAPATGPGAAAPPGQTQPAPPPEAGAPSRGPVYRLSKRVAYTFLGPRISAKVRQQLLQPRETAAEALRRSEASLRRIEELEQQVASLQRRSLDVELVGVEVHAATVNLELLKGEVNSVERTLEDLGMAIAPATGLAGAGMRLSELRERVNGLDRRLRAAISATLSQPSSPSAEAGAGEARAAGRTEAPAAPPESALFDYVAFERRFRGDPEAITAQMSERYLDLLAENAPVIDVGCGRGELVELLAARGIEAIGVDTDPSMVAEARERGLDVRLVDGGSFLRGLEPGSIGSIIATHVVEHIDLDALVELLELAATRLRPGGVLIAETPNPASLIVLGNSYILDPTHVRPLHPSLLAFLCEGAGFRDVRLRFYAPATGYHLPKITDPQAPPWVKQVNEAFGKLNEVLFGPQEYAVIAHAAPALDAADAAGEAEEADEAQDEAGNAKNRRGRKSPKTPTTKGKGGSAGK
jgi:SAM-dependent methyltransferase